MIPFGLLKWGLWTQAYASVYFNGTILFGLIPFVVPYISKWAKKGKSQSSQEVPNGKQD